jgi:hypothetical protein
MKGDFSRFTFKQYKHYSKVNKQQGKCSVEADDNEQIDILHHYERTALKDVIGQSGIPKSNINGFEIKASGSSYLIKQGRLYIDGALFENEFDVEADKQPDLPSLRNGMNPALPGRPGYYLVYLEGWERHITELDDPGIKEVALGGPDTATRSQLVWQAKLHPILDVQDSSVEGRVNCQTPLTFWNSLVSPPNGTLIARAKPEITTDDPCKIKPGLGYNGLQNQLCRIEIHHAGTAGKGATWKYSWDNGVVVTRALDITEQKVTVEGVGKDPLIFNNQQWIEVIDDLTDKHFLPGVFAKVNVASEEELEIINGTIKGGTLSNADFPQEHHPKVRRWDSEGGYMPVSIPSSNDGFLDVGNNLEIRFQRNAQYRTADFWYVPCRTLNRMIDWPRTVNGAPQPKLPDGIQRHFTRLAILKCNNDMTIEVLDDCRNIFPPLTDLGDIPSPGPAPSIANVSTRAHGNIAWAEKPNVLSNTDHKQGIGAVFQQSGGTNTIHFPLSNSFIADDSAQLHLTHLYLFYSTEDQNVQIASIRLFDGKNPISSITGPFTGDHSLNTDSFNNWKIHPPIHIRFGLGISVSVKFNRKRKITFHSVGADFTRAS